MRSNTTYNVCKWHSDEWHNAISGPAYRTKVKLQMAADDNNNREKKIAKTILSMSQLWANKFIVRRDYSIASLMSRNNKIEIEIHRTARWWLAFVSSECLRNAFFFLVFRVFCCYTRLISKSRGLRLIVDLRSFYFSFVSISEKCENHSRTFIIQAVWCTLILTIQRTIHTALLSVIALHE